MTNFNSKIYWEHRYKNNGNSGKGSYGEESSWKSHYINKVIERFNLKTLNDFGHGDCNQLKNLRGFKHYTGYDPSEFIRNKCKIEFNSEKYNFVDSVHDVPYSDLSFSLDVIYHLVEEEAFEDYMDALFTKSKYVIIYSTNYSESPINHIRHRKFTEYVEKKYKNYELIETDFSFRNDCGMFLYKKNLIQDITVILNCYKRPEYLDEQILSIENQSIKPKEIWIWYNSPETGQQIDLEGKFNSHKIIKSNYNFKFHARFALGLLAKTEYVAFFDDDTIPGNRWFENCLLTLEMVGDSVLGTTGVILNSDKYEGNSKVGWNGEQINVPKEVDLVGHAWFLRQENLKYLWYEKPESLENGEDIQLSYLCQKYGKLKTYVPPHAEDYNFWGSLPEKGNVYGTDAHATWVHNIDHRPIRNQIVKNLISKGWSTVNSKYSKQNKI